MRKFLSVAVYLIALTTFTVAASKSVPLLALWKARAGHENTLWMESRTKIGKESVVGYIQGTGGGDEALMGYQFEEDWDMLTAVIGFKKGTPRGREAEFHVEAGGKVLFSSGLMESGGPSQKIRVPIRGHRRILLRIASERYNGTAGAAWGEPMLFSGLSEEEMKNDWNLSVNNRKTPLPGASAPPEVLVPFDVPLGEETEYTVKIRRDEETRTVIVEKVKADS